jgi:glycosyltransferase involved in cell wall biosynthesis
MNSPVTVVIPTYNGVRYIEEALSSVFAQTEPPHEIIVVDDASRDSTADLVSSLAVHSPVPLRLIRLAKNSGGPSHPMNVGMAACRTPFVATLDQDDLMAPTRLAVQSRVLQKHPQVPAVIGLLHKIDGDGLGCDDVSEVKYRARLLTIPHQSAEDAYLLDPSAFYNHVLLQETYSIASNTMMRRSAWEAIGGFALHLRVAWDMDMCCRLALCGPIAFVDHVIGSYRLHEENTSAKGLTCYREALAVKAAQLRCPLFSIDRIRLQRDVAQRYFALGYHESIRGNSGLALKAYAKAWSHGIPSHRTLFAMVKATLHSCIGSARTGTSPSRE